MTPFAPRAGMRRRLLRCTVLSAALVLAAACAQLPDYARPRMAATDAAPGAAFSYRALTPEDFRAASPPEEAPAGHHRINAHSAIQIRPTPDSRFGISRGELDGRTYFFGRIDRLAFQAVMLPEASWWNPGIPADLRRYVLEHEQIHFALTEIAARRLTIASRDWASEVLVIAPVPEDVQAEMGRRIKERIISAMEANLDRHAEFDQETSLFFSPRRQQWWMGTVREELEQTRHAAAR